MLRNSRKWLWMALLLSTIAADGAWGQWRIVAPNLIPPVSNYDFTTMTFKDGLLCVAAPDELLISKDSGKTWSRNEVGSTGSEVTFFDQNFGVVVCDSGGGFLTKDGGLTWNSIPGIIISTSRSVIFLGSHDSILVGDNNLIELTTDFGKTWQKYASPQPWCHELHVTSNSTSIMLGSIINPVRNGLPYYAYIYVSDDGGQTWYSKSGSVFWDSYSFAIDKCDDMTLYVADEENAYHDTSVSLIYVSTDQGASFTMTWGGASGELGTAIAAMPNSVYCASLNGVLRSTDQGLSWSNIGGPTVAIDTRLLTAASDNVLFAFDTNGNFWVTFNSGGDSVRSSSSVNSSLSVSPKKLFASDTIACDSITRSILVRRRSCSAPSVLASSVIGPDSSSFHSTNLTNDSISVTLSAVNEGNQNAMLVLYLDNGSSDTVALAGYVSTAPNTLTASPAMLFESDTISCDSLTHRILFSRGGCSLVPDSVSAWSIVGSDAASFSASNLSFVSILVTLYGTKQGSQNAKLVLLLYNGKSDTVTLAGYVNISPNALTLSTKDVKTDTLGATVAVPITINGLERPEDVDLIIHYDGTMDYLGSFSPSGAKLDIAGQQWTGRSELNIPGALPGVVAGYAKFNVFNDSNVAAHASFGLVSVLTANSPCEYSLPKAVTSTITAPSGCGITILSRLIHLGVEPQFTVRPNPTTGDIELGSSEDVGDASISIFDMLGRDCGEQSVSLTTGAEAHLAMPTVSGLYHLRIESAAGVSFVSVMVNR